MIATISDYFALGKEQEDLEFFDSYLGIDNRLFIDPFLLKRGGVEEEIQLFTRFETFFDEILELVINLKLGGSEEELRKLLYFREPKEINLGYTENGNQGNGPGKEFGKAMISFLKSSIVSKVFDKDIRTEAGFNPNVLRVFVNGLGPDGISDFSAGLIMDYLISFTQEQCKKHGIKTKSLPSPNIFDFEDFCWYDGYFELPEDPTDEGKPIIFVPKRLLRYIDDSFDNGVKRKVVGFLKNDENLSSKFESLIDKRLTDIKIDEIRRVLTLEKSALKDLVIDLEGGDNAIPYDFGKDVFELSSYNSYKDTIEESNIDFPNVTNGEELFNLAKIFLNFLEEEYVIRNGWINAWEGNKHCSEPTFGRFIRGVGFAFFNFYSDITFIAERGTGNGFLDFSLIYKSNRISIELKNLGNTTKKGEANIPSYIHGLTTQLPEYMKASKSNYGIYITLQHYASDNDKKTELESYVKPIEAKMQEHNPSFKEIIYKNLDLTKKETASNK